MHSSFRTSAGFAGLRMTTRKPSNSILIGCGISLVERIGHGAVAFLNGETSEGSILDSERIHGWPVEQRCAILKVLRSAGTDPVSKCCLEPIPQPNDVRALCDRFRADEMVAVAR